MLVKPITPTIGVEISDVSLAELNKSQLQQIRELFIQHMVLVFRDQHLSRDEHKSFARHFGDLHIHPSKQNSFGSLKVGDDPEVFIIDTKPEARQSNGEAWHSDVSCEEIPPLASLLYVTKTPENDGGDTMFANMHEIYEALSDDLKTLLNSKYAFHGGEIDLRNYGIRLKPEQSYPKTIHPVVAVHPDTLRPYLFVNGSFTSHIEGIAKWESDMLLDGLHRFVAASPKFQCRVKWHKNTLTMWDNRSVQHHAIRDYIGFSRYGERVSVLAQERPQPLST
jgi:taurine dioxygenase